MAVGPIQKQQLQEKQKRQRFRSKTVSTTNYLVSKLIIHPSNEWLQDQLYKLLVIFANE